MESYKRDSYHVVKNSRPTPRLARVIIYLFIDFLFTEFSKWQTEIREGSGLFPLFFVYCFRIPLFWVYRALLEYMLSKRAWVETFGRAV